ncbi:MAG: LysR family transcriptional regulator [Myxococcales bacterium]|nr:LysR family transcriptional regulator [Myxococcales bacterium]
MDLNEIVVFAKVVETKSFTAAAQQLGLPKSTVSRKVSQLEERLDARLLQRTTRKLSLTEIGQAYYERCQRIVADIASAEQLVGDMQTTPRGRLKVTAPVDIGAFRLGELTAAFLTKQPDIDVHLELTDRVVDLVDEGYDLGIRFGPLPESSLVARRLTTLAMGLYASPAYLERRGTPTDPDELGEHDLLVFAPVPRLATWTLQGPTGQVELTPSARLTSNNLLAVHEAARNGAGIAYIAGFVLRCAGDSVLVPVLPTWRSAPIDLFAVYPSGRNLAPKVRLYLDYLAEQLGQSGGL